MWDGTYTFLDLIHWHELSYIKAENQRRYREWTELSRDK